MKPKNFPDRKRQRQLRALERLAAADANTAYNERSRIVRRFGADDQTFGIWKRFNLHQIATLLGIEDRGILGSCRDIRTKKDRSDRARLVRS